MSTISRTPCDVPFGGRKRTLRRIRSMSALPLKADIVSRICHVRFVPKPDRVRRNKEYRYSITSSAVASNLSGTVSPRNRRPCPRDKDNSDRGRAHTEDRIGPQIDQFFCQRPHPIRISGAPAKFDPEITAFRPSQLRERSPERREPRLRG
jgi:hypothetical protein